MLEKIYEWLSLDAEGITIPFPQRDVHMYNQQQT